MSVQVKNNTALQAAFLEQLSGQEKGRVFALRSTRLTIGRSSENDIVVDAPGVSRVHALLVCSEGSWFIRDNQSKNGVLVNGRKVQDSWLENKDEVQLGTFVFCFNEPAHAEGGAGDLIPEVATAMGGDLVGGQGAGSRKKAGNPRILVYVAVLLILGAFLMMGPSEKGADNSQPGDPQQITSAHGFEMAKKPHWELGSEPPIPPLMEDPLLKKAEREMAQLDWSNSSLREAEQFFRKGQREYLNKSYHRAIDSFQTALSLYSEHMLAERYMRHAIYQAENQAKNHMAMAIRYYESLQYSRAIHHFNEVVALMVHRPDESTVNAAKEYIKQSELRLQAAELFP